MLPALSQVCTLRASLEADVADFSAGHCPAVELWWGKVETYLADHSVAELRRLLDAHGMAAPVASYQGGLLTSQGAARKEHWELFARRLELARQLGIGTLVVAGDVEGPLAQQDFERLQVSLRHVAEQAATAGVRVALEFQARAAIPNNLESAAALVADCNHPSLGLCLDLFHFATGASKTEDLAHLSAANLFHVQLCDLAGTLRELATDADRILPGDGDLAIEPLITRLREIGYTGTVSIELMNPQLWEVPPRQFGEIAMTALRKVLGLASMG